MLLLNLHFCQKGNWDASLPDLKLYSHSKKDLTVMAYDIDTNPALTKKYNVTKDSTLVIGYKGMQRLVYPTNHLNITNTLLKLLRNKEIKVYFTQGHGELDPRLKDREGASYLAQTIQSSSYQIGTVNLLKAGLPPDAYALMILGLGRAFIKRNFIA